MEITITLEKEESTMCVREKKEWKKETGRYWILKYFILQNSFLSVDGAVNLAIPLMFAVTHIFPAFPFSH